MPRAKLLLIAFEAVDAAILEQMRGAIDLVTVGSVDEAIDAMLRVRPTVVILHGSTAAVKPTDLARSLRGLVTEDVIVLHAGTLPEAAATRTEIDGELSRPLRLPEVLEVLDRIHRDGGTELKITTRMPRLR